MFDTDKYEEQAQAFEDAVIETLNSIPNKGLYIGPACDCDECLSTWGYEDDEDEDGNVTRTAADKAREDQESDNWIDEGGFSWRDCECCRSTLGGDRYAAHAFDEDMGLIHYDVCSDCVLYLANGDLPINGWRRYPDDD